MAAKYQRYWGFAEVGSQQSVTGGQSSTNKLQASFPTATITVYINGTLTPASIFSDQIGTPKANPFTVDVNGYFFFYAADGRYTATMTGVGIPTTSWGDLQLLTDTPTMPATGAVSRSLDDTVYDWKSVKNFGALGDNTADDSAAIAAALAWGAANNKQIMFPGGTYKCVSPITMPAGNVRFFGMIGYAGSVSTIRFTGTANLLGDLANGGISARNIKIQSAAGGFAGFLVDIAAAHVDGESRLELLNVTLTNPDTSSLGNAPTGFGLRLRADNAGAGLNKHISWTKGIECYFDGWVAGILLEADGSGSNGGNFTNGNQFVACTFYNCKQMVRMTATNGAEVGANLFNNCNHQVFNYDAAHPPIEINNGQRNQLLNIYLHDVPGGQFGAKIDALSDRNMLQGEFGNGGTNGVNNLGGPKNMVLQHELATVFDMQFRNGYFTNVLGFPAADLSVAAQGAQQITFSVNSNGRLLVRDDIPVQILKNGTGHKLQFNAGGSPVKIWSEFIIQSGTAQAYTLAFSNDNGVTFAFARLQVDSDGTLHSAGPMCPQDTGARLYSGSVAPEGVVTADRGSTYMRTTGNFYVKTANDGAPTGWTLVI